MPRSKLARRLLCRMDGRAPSVVERYRAGHISSRCSAKEWPQGFSVSLIFGRPLIVTDVTASRSRLTAETARIVTGAAGGIAGARYRPSAEIVPFAAPPSTNQWTLLLLEPATFATN